MVSARSSMVAWALFSAPMVFCATADQRTAEQAKASKDLLSALDNADLSDLLENDLDEAFLFRRRSHAANLKNLNIHGQIDRLLQAEDEEEGTVPTVSPTVSPTASSASEGGEGGNMPSGAPTPSSKSTDREGGGDMTSSPSASPTWAPTGDGGISRDASAAWRRPTSRLLGGVLIGVVTGMTMTVMVAL